jgi:hypothetical protein
VGRVTFEEKNKTTTSSDYPRLKLEKGEKARIVCLENPEAAFVHTLRAPKLINGMPKMITRERQNGETFEDYDQDFIGRPICLGDEGILEERGSDPKNCPICKMASEGDMAQSPQRRFAMHVFKYATRTGTTEIIEPFSGQLVVWSFTDKIFGKLVDFATEWGNLQAHDLLLGPCTNPTFQQYDIGISGKAEWTASPDRRNYVAVMFRENQTKDLASFCGRRQDRRYLEEDLDKVRQRWAIISGRGTGTPQPDPAVAAEAPTLAEGLGDLLSQQADTSLPSREVQQGPSDTGLADLLGTPGIGVPKPASEPAHAAPDPEFRAPEPAPTTAAQPATANVTASLLEDEPASPPAERPVEPQMTVKPGSSGEVVNFDDLLGVSS